MPLVPCRAASFILVRRSEVSAGRLSDQEGKKIQVIAVDQSVGGGTMAYWRRSGGVAPHFPAGTCLELPPSTLARRISIRRAFFFHALARSGTGAALPCR